MDICTLITQVMPQGRPVLLARSHVAPARRLKIICFNDYQYRRQGPPPSVLFLDVLTCLVNRCF